MKIFIVGLPGSGRTTISKALCENPKWKHIDATAWMKLTFRDKMPSEHIQQYMDEYHTYLLSRMRIHPDVFVDNIIESMKAYKDEATHFVIDGVSTPRDLIKLFDINNDIIIFLNRTDTEPEFKDHENVGFSVMRDYCFWMSSAGMISKDRWLEFNFKIPGEDCNAIKVLGSKNTVIIVKSINAVINKIKEIINEIPG